MTLDALDDGFLLHHDVSSLIKEAETGCEICALVWWSLRYDHASILENELVSTRLFLNPPRSKSHIVQQLDVLVTKRDISEFLWLPSYSSEPWHFGPPDFRSDIFRSHLAFFACRSGFPLLVKRDAQLLIMLKIIHL